MKKILGISLVAVLAVSPMMAMAEGELRSAVAIAGPLNDTTGSAFTTQSYVKGAYNAVETDLGLVNAAVTTLNGNDQTAGSVKKEIKDKAALATYNANDEGYVAGTIGYAIKNAVSTSATSAGDGLAKSAEGVFSVKVDDTTVGLNANKQLEVKAGSIGTTQLAPAVVTSLGKADNALQAADITTGETAGAIMVGQTAVPVAGLADVATTGAASDITTDTSHQFVTDQQITNWQAAADAVSNASTGLASKQDQLTNGTNNIDATVKTSIATGENGDNASDTALLTESAVYNAIEAAKTAATYDDTALQNAVSANTTAISTINNKQIPVATIWGGANGADSTSTVTISSLGPVADNGGE